MYSLSEEQWTTAFGYVYELKLKKFSWDTVVCNNATLYNFCSFFAFQFNYHCVFFFTDYIILSTEWPSLLKPRRILNNC